MIANIRHSQLLFLLISLIPLSSLAQTESAKTPAAPRSKGTAKVVIPAVERSQAEGKKPLVDQRPYEGSARTGLGRGLPILRHEARAGVPFARGETAFLYRGSVPIEDPYGVDLKGNYNMPLFPPCKGSRVSRKEVYHNSPFSQAIDLLFYDAKNRAEYDYAQKWFGYSVPYRSGKIASTDASFNPWSMYAMTSGVICLPARVKYSTEGTRRFFEIREGSAAWEKTPEDVALEQLRSEKKSGGTPTAIKP